MAIALVRFLAATGQIALYRNRQNNYQSEAEQLPRAFMAEPDDAEREVRIGQAYVVVGLSSRMVVAQALPSSWYPRQPLVMREQGPRRW